MNIIKKMDCKVPEWAMSAIFNSDYSGIFGTDVMFLETWLAWLEVKTKEFNASSFVVTQKADMYKSPYFDNEPAFGLPCDVYDCVVLFFE